MTREIRISVAVWLLLLPIEATAQAPPQSKPPVAPKAEQLDPDSCARPDTQATVGSAGQADARDEGGKRSLSDKLAHSGGVICPPEHVDPEIRQPTPPTGAMPVIPPPGSPGGDQSIQPK